MIRCSSSSSAPNSPSSPSISPCRASGSAASIVISFGLHALDVDRAASTGSRRAAPRTGRAPTAGRTRTGGSPRAAPPRCGSRWGRATSRSRTCRCSPPRTAARRAPIAAPPRRTGPGPAAPRKPRTEPTWAPISSGEICASMPLIACISAGMESPWARIIASDTRCAAGSSSAFMLSAFALTHSARRIARTSATSVGASRPVNRATCSSATRTASSNARSFVVGRLAVLAGLDGARHAHLARELPVHGPGRGRHHPLHLTEQRRVGRDSGSIPNGKPPRPPGGSLIPPSYDRAFVTMAPCQRPSSPLRSTTRILARVQPDPLSARRGAGLRRRPRRGRHLRVPGDRARPFGRRRRHRTHLRGLGRPRGAAPRGDRGRGRATLGPVRRVVAPPHRRAAGRGGQRGRRRLGAPSGRGLRGRRHAIERLKEDVPIWKKEGLVSGEAHWVMGS